jgi:hypothetical protein
VSGHETLCLILLVQSGDPVSTSLGWNVLDPVFMSFVVHWFCLNWKFGIRIFEIQMTCKLYFLDDFLISHVEQ